jgi:hypothetical protein
MYAARKQVPHIASTTQLQGRTRGVPEAGGFSESCPRVRPLQAIIRRAGKLPAIDPAPGMLPPMNAREDDDLLRRGGINETIWKAPQQYTTQTLIQRWELIRTPQHRGGVQRSQELCAQTSSSTFVQLGCLLDLVHRLRTKNESGAHTPKRLRSRARASSHGTAEPGSASCSASRRSNSRRCSSSSPSRAESGGMLSQRSCASWMRSASLSFRSSEKGIVLIAGIYRTARPRSSLPPQAPNDPGAHWRGAVLQNRRST